MAKGMHVKVQLVPKPRRSESLRILLYSIYGFSDFEHKTGQNVGFDGLLPQKTAASSEKQAYNDGLEPTSGPKEPDFGEPIDRVL